MEPPLLLLEERLGNGQNETSRLDGTRNFSALPEEGWSGKAQLGEDGQKETTQGKALSGNRHGDAHSSASSQEVTKRGRKAWKFTWRVKRGGKSCSWDVLFCLRVHVQPPLPQSPPSPHNENRLDNSPVLAVVHTPSCWMGGCQQAARPLPALLPIRMWTESRCSETQPLPVCRP